MDVLKRGRSGRFDPGAGGLWFQRRAIRKFAAAGVRECSIVLMPDGQNGNPGL